MKLLHCLATSALWGLLGLSTVESKLASNLKDGQQVASELQGQRHVKSECLL
jgi:hypothetical protein